MSDNRTAEQLAEYLVDELRTFGMGVQEWNYNHELITKALKEYASQQTASLREENERLKSWKELMLKIWGPVIDWGQSKEAGLRPGTDITNELLRRAQEYKQLQEEVERLISLLRKVNTAIQHSNMKGTILHSEIKKALSSKESKTDK